MRAVVSVILSIIFSAVAVAQVNVAGTVIDADMGGPVSGASVIVRGADGKIKKFASSKADGGFAMSVATSGLPSGGVGNEV